MMFDKQPVENLPNFFIHFKLEEASKNGCSVTPGKIGNNQFILFRRGAQPLPRNRQTWQNCMPGLHPVGPAN